MAQNLYYTKLNNRGLVRLDGPDRHDFLQNLVTNNMDKLAPGRALYACLLTPQGKFLHDFFISEGNGFTLLECEGGARAQDLYTRLNRYKLRADVQISVEEDVQIYAIFSPAPLTSPLPQAGEGTWGEGRVYPDPRHPAIGYRSFTKPEGLEEKSFEAWDRHRIKLCIPDGSRDLIPEKSTMDEGNMDRLNAIDYEKGCYVGQELTARMHHRGLGKRHLECVKVNELPEGAELRSICGDIGLALVKSANP